MIADKGYASNTYRGAVAEEGGEAGIMTNSPPAICSAHSSLLPSL
jgi:hypothetical protein